MGHYAKINENGIVQQVIVAKQDFIETLPDKEFWIKTSYNTHRGIHWNRETKQPSDDQSKALRKNYAGIGWTYDPVRDAFIPPKPFPSWVLNENTCLWDCPVQMPDDEKAYVWDESITNWVEVPNGS